MRFGSGRIGGLVALTAGDGLAKAMGFAASIWLARALTPSMFGRLAFAQAIVTYLALPAYFGLSVHGARTIAARRDLTPRVLLNVTVLRVITVGAVFTVSAIAAWMAPIDELDRGAILVSLLVLLPLSLTPEWAAQGMSKLLVVGAARATGRATMLALTVLIIRNGSDILRAAALKPIAEIAAQIPLWIAVVSAARPAWKDLDVASWPQHLKRSFPLLGAVLFSSVYAGSSDQIILRIYWPVETVGLYAAAYTVYQAVGGALALASFAYLPRLSEAAGITRSAFRRTQREFLVLVSASGLILGVGIGAGAPLILRFGYGIPYAPAAPVLEILSLSALVLGIGSVYTTSLIALGRERQLVVAYAAGMVVNLGLNLILVPYWSMYGAALSTLAAEAVVLVTALGLSRTIDDQKVDHG